MTIKEIPSIHPLFLAAAVNVCTLHSVSFGLENLLFLKRDNLDICCPQTRGLILCLLIIYISTIFAKYLKADNYKTSSLSLMYAVL